MRKEYINDCPGFLKDFLTHLKVIRGRADRTEEAYYIDLRTFLRYIKLTNGLVSPECEFEQISIADVDFEYIKDFKIYDAYNYLRFLKDERGNSKKTRARKCSALKQFYFYLSKKAMMIKEDPLTDLELPKIDKQLPRYLSLEQSQDLLSTVSSDGSVRDFCILVLFLNCGMRLSELVGLDINDYSKDNRTLRIFGKGGKERLVFLNNACVQALEQYLAERNADPKNADLKAIFISRNHRRITTRRVQMIVEESLKKAGLNNLGISTHKLRHTAATLMYQYGHVDMLVLKEILGHESTSTTEIYTHLASENLKNAAEASPLANVAPPKKKNNT